MKATSFTSEIADRLVRPGSKALFLYAAPEAYLENILAGQNSWQTLRALSPARLARLQGRCAGFAADPGAMHDGLKAALGWACEMTSLERAASALPHRRRLWMDFDISSPIPPPFLAPSPAISGSRRGCAGAGDLRGPLMGRYSKALDYEYSRSSGARSLAEARRVHAPRIRDALNWLGGPRSRYPAAAQAIWRARGEADVQGNHSC